MCLEENNIPGELRELPLWCVHVNKVPYRPRLKYNKLVKAKSSDKETWGKFEEATQLVGNKYIENIYNKETKKYDITEEHTVTGLSIGIESPYVAIDLDHVINDKGQVLKEAMEIIELINSYTEISPSGTGVHIILKSNKPLPKHGYKNMVIKNEHGWDQTEENKPMIEIYQKDRIMTFTNNVFEEYSVLNECEEGLYKVYEMYFKDREEKPQNKSSSKAKPINYQEYDGEDKEVDLKAEEVIITLLQLSKGNTKERFERLFNGDISEYGSGSEADFAICGILARQTKDTRVIDCVYRKSKLYEGERQLKWDRPDYKKSTIEKAIRSSQFNSKGLKVNDKGFVLHTKENVVTVLNKLGFVVGYNVLNNEIGITNKIYKEDIGYLMNDVYSYCRGIGFNINRSDLESHVFYIARDNRYNPFMDYLIKCESENKQCFGELNKLIQTLTFDIPVGYIDDYKAIENLYRSMIKKWLISVVALNLVDDLRITESKSLEGTLILKGKQGIGKTTWFRNLVPYGYFKEGATLTDSKDNKIETYQYILVELGELETTTNKQATGFLKQELTRPSVEYRPPYAKSTMKFARHTVFCGSVNEDSFLRDSTGNRRFWVIPIKSIDLEAKIDIDKLWAEIVCLKRSGMKWHLDKEERKLLEELNGEYINITAVGLAIQNTFDFSKPKDEWIYITMNSVYELIREQIKNHVTQNSIGEQLRILGCEKKQRRIINGENPMKVWIVPPPKVKYYKMGYLEIWRKENGVYRNMEIDFEGTIK